MRILIVALVFLAPFVAAQPIAGSTGLSARESAVIDITGQWVAIVNEDWRWRMRTPPKGDYSSVQTLNARGRAVADAWTEADDGHCKAYGAGALLRMPTRLRIAWDGDNVLQIESDAGSQIRRLNFAPPASGEQAPSLQGRSVARWQRPLTPPGRLGFPRPPGTGPQLPGGSLVVDTTQLSEGWLRRNGVPYSSETQMTEYFDRFDVPDGTQWLVVTTIILDPRFHNGRFITSSHFRQESDRSRWNPTSCRE